MSPKEFLPASYSKMTVTELMVPAFANFSGKIHGGILLSLMDKVAYACASKHSKKYCVTVSVDNVEFLQPVEVGEMVSMMASINYVGNSSMIIGIKVIAEDFHKGTVKHTNSSYFTMVAKDENGKPAPVPGLLLETPDDVRRFLKSIRRKELKKQYRNNMEHAPNAGELKNHLHLLEKENCQLNFSL